MYKKFLIISSKKDKAGVGITTALSQFRQNPLAAGIQKDSKGFDFYLRDEEIISDENLDHEKISKYDFIIFASKHQSEKGDKSLSVHAPGNWRNAEMGGKSNTVCQTSALFMKKTFEILKRNAKKLNLKDYKVTLEVTHHGPYIEKPCMFIEIGSSEEQWSDRRAAFVIAKTISEAIEKFEPNPHREIAIGLGGPHYSPNFNKIQATSNVAISHIIPNYVMPITEEMIKQAIEKTQEEVDFALIDWKGLGISEQRQEVIDLLEKNYISWKRTSDIEK